MKAGRAKASHCGALIEKRQIRLQANAEAIERWQRRLFRAATELKKLTQERKCLLYPNGRTPTAIKYRKLEDIPRMAGGGDEFNDDVPL
jgi:hypothetical protein